MAGDDFPHAASLVARMKETYNGKAFQAAVTRIVFLALENGLDRDDLFKAAFTVKAVESDQLSLFAQGDK